MKNLILKVMEVMEVSALVMAVAHHFRGDVASATHMLVLGIYFHICAKAQRERA